MKKIKDFLKRNYNAVWVLIVVVGVIISLIACTSPAVPMDAETNLTSEEVVLQFANENERLKEELSVYKSAENPEEAEIMYMVTLNIKQVHYTLDITEHIKDGLNDIEITIPVDKTFYEEIKEGDTLNDNFRWGSLLAKGSLGKWKITVKDKTIQLNEN